MSDRNYKINREDLDDIMSKLMIKVSEICSDGDLINGSAGLHGISDIESNSGQMDLLCIDRDYKFYSNPKRRINWFALFRIDDRISKRNDDVTRHKLAIDHTIIGEITDGDKVIVQTLLGKRILPVPTGRIVPRIC